MKIKSYKAYEKALLKATMLIKSNPNLDGPKATKLEELLEAIDRYNAIETFVEDNINNLRSLEDGKHGTR